jgi:hypothetical protein
MKALSLLLTFNLGRDARGLPQRALRAADGVIIHEHHVLDVGLGDREDQRRDALAEQGPGLSPARSGQPWRCTLFLVDMTTISVRRPQMREAPVSRQSSRESRRRAIEQARAAEARRKRRLQLGLAGGAIVILAAAGTGIGLAVSGGGSASASGSTTGSTGSSADYAALSTLGSLTAAPAPGPLGPESVPVPSAPALAGTSSAATGQTVDGISCQTSEQTVFHIHTHLTVFVNGQQRQVPAAIGILGAVAQQTPVGPFIGSGTCFYFLHTHAADGIIHIESPVQRTYTLGDFFDVWGQPLSSDQAGPAKGKVTVIINGKVYTGNPRNAPLGSHENLQLEVGTPLVAPMTINWAKTGL